MGDYELIDNPKAVTNYVSKWIDRDCEYDLVYNIKFYTSEWNNNPTTIWIEN